MTLEIGVGALILILIMLLLVMVYFGGLSIGLAIVKLISGIPIIMWVGILIFVLLLSGGKKK